MSNLRNEDRAHYHNKKAPLKRGSFGGDEGNPCPANIKS